MEKNNLEKMSDFFNIRADHYDLNHISVCFLNMSIMIHKNKKIIYFLNTRK